MKKKANWRINEDIRSPELRVIDAKGKQIGILKRADALSKAKGDGLDLIEIAPKAKPPVVKLMDFGKFRYQEEKKLKEEKKKSKAAELKEVRFSPFIGEADYMTRLKRVNEFLKEGNKVKLVVVFKGRQMNSKKFGYELFEKMAGNIEYPYVIDMEPKLIGRHLAMVVSPLKKKIKLDKDGEKNKTEDKKIGKPQV